MAFQPSNTLASRTFVGLIVAQFLAAFNDQAIHASAMFFAINQQTLSEATAISLMPILFYAPWAIFCTIAGFFADRYSKRQSLVFWKVAEVGITLVALAGFWMGTHGQALGPWVVLSTVFLMGTHSAFFVPAKYGVMPEILEPHLLSKGNGVLESLSFLAVILGTVTGGILSFLFLGREHVIGLILCGLAVVGALASLLIRRMPAADPKRPFPPFIYRPLVESVKILWRSKPLRVAVLGIAFFTFIVAFMRSTVYMHGESRIPRWTEFRTSLVVGMSALGIGLGSPLAGYLSGGKIELGLVPLGAVGMMISAVIAAVYLNSLPALIVCIILIGFFTGFYIVPLFTLLQHRAPKTNKGDVIATSNFINVTGAILASLLFFALDHTAHWTGLAPEVAQQDNWAKGELNRVDYNQHARPVYFEIEEKPNVFRRAGIPTSPLDDGIDISLEEEPVHPGTTLVFNLSRGLEPAEVVRAKGPKIQSAQPSHVIVSTYTIHGVVHYNVRPSNQPLGVVYNDEGVPRYLFLGTALMTLITLVLLCRQLPDFMVRSLLWLRTQGRHRLKVVGINNLPAEGPVILATNCDRFQECMQVIAATDRHTRFILLERADDEGPRRPLLRYLARRVGLVALRKANLSGAAWSDAQSRAAKTLKSGDVLALTVETGEMSSEAESFFNQISGRDRAILLPVYCGTSTPGDAGADGSIVRKTRVVLGRPVSGATAIETIRHEIQVLGDWVHASDRTGAALATIMMPGGAGKQLPTSGP